MTALLVPGENVIGAILGDGWWRGKVGAFSTSNLYGETLALLLQLHITYTDGRVEWVRSDQDWLAATGPILSADLKDGEVLYVHFPQAERSTLVQDNQPTIRPAWMKCFLLRRPSPC